MISEFDKINTIVLYGRLLELVEDKIFPNFKDLPLEPKIGEVRVQKYLFGLINSVDIDSKHERYSTVLLNLYEYTRKTTDINRLMNIVVRAECLIYAVKLSSGINNVIAVRNIRVATKQEVDVLAKKEERIWKDIIINSNVNNK